MTEQVAMSVLTIVVVVLAYLATRQKRRHEPPAKSINCPACGNLMFEDHQIFYGGYMRVCFDCGKPWIVSCRDSKTIRVEPFDAEGDLVTENIIRYNYDKGRRERGCV